MHGLQGHGGQQDSEPHTGLDMDSPLDTQTSLCALRWMGALSGAPDGEVAWGSAVWNLLSQMLERGLGQGQHWISSDSHREGKGLGGRIPHPCLELGEGN